MHMRIWKFYAAQNTLLAGVEKVMYQLRSKEAEHSWEVVEAEHSWEVVKVISHFKSIP